MGGGAPHMAQRSEVNRQLSGDEVEVEKSLLLLCSDGGKFRCFHSFSALKGGLEETTNPSSTTDVLVTTNPFSTSNLLAPSTFYQPVSW